MEGARAIANVKDNVEAKYWKKINRELQFYYYINDMKYGVKKLLEKTTGYNML